MTRQLNPILVRELRGGLRSGRRVALLTFFLVVVGAFFLSVFQVAATTLQFDSSAADGAAVGGAFFPLVVGVELFFVCTITPGQTVGAIADERERQTYDLLLITPLRPAQIVLGKLGSGLAYVALLLLAALPLQSLAFLMGGVGIQELLVAFLMLIFSALLFGSLGLWSSALFRTSRGASAFAYAMTGLLTLGLPVGAVFWAPLSAILFQAHQSLIDQPPAWLIYVGELVAATNPWSAGGLAEVQLQTGKPLLWFHQSFGKTHVDMPGPWLVFLVVYGVGTCLLLWWTARLVRRRAGA